MEKFTKNDEVRLDIWLKTLKKNTISSESYVTPI